MSAFQFVIMSVYALTAWYLMERRYNRGLAWVLVAAGAYLVTSTYWRAGGPEPALFSGVVDGAACLAIYLWGRYRWELLIWRMFQFMILVNIARLAGIHGFIPAAPAYLYSTAFEITNVLIALVSGGIATVIGARTDAGSAGGLVGRIRGLGAALHQKRTEPPFWKVKG